MWGKETISHSSARIELNLQEIWSICIHGIQNQEHGTQIWFKEQRSHYSDYAKRLFRDVSQSIWFVLLIVGINFVVDDSVSALNPYPYWGYFEAISRIDDAAQACN